MENVVFYCGDSLETLKGLADDSVDLIFADPPYHRVKAVDWDRQWATDQIFLDWLQANSQEWHRVLKPNGSLYVCASRAQAASVAHVIASRFEVLNTIRWHKPDGWHKKQKKEVLRSLASDWEALIFAEHQNADSFPKGRPGYELLSDREKGALFEPIRSYLGQEFDRAGVPRKEANQMCSVSSMAYRHYFGGSQWSFPTRPHYEAMQRGLNPAGEPYVFLSRPYAELREEYEAVLEGYEQRRRELEAAYRRPFFASADVALDDWTLPPVKPYPGKHPCEKPLALLMRILKLSTHPGAVVLDPFMGSGSMGEACMEMGRSYIGIDFDPHWVEVARQRVLSPSLTRWAA